MIRAICRGAADFHCGICRTCGVRWMWFGAPSSYKKARCPADGTLLEKTLRSAGSANGEWKMAYPVLLQGSKTRELARLTRRWQSGMVAGKRHFVRTQ